MLSMTKRSGKRRIAEADRTQVRVLMVDPDGLVPDDDPVRAVWSFVERLDLSAFYEPIKAFEGTAGRPPIDLKILMALWIQATLDGIGSAGSRRRDAARKRAAEEQLRRIDEALAELPDVQKRKKSNNGKKKSEARTSTTDPQARVMKMADAGYRPALNVHMVTDTRTKVIAAVEVNNEGTDLKMAVPLADQIHQRYGKNPSEWLEDGGCVTLDGIDKLAGRGIRVIAPVRQPRSSAVKATEVRATDSEAVADWRRRMETEEAKTIYKERGATAELVNAHARGHGLLQFLVRGIRKTRSVMLLLAITHNMRRSWALAPAI